MVPWWLRSEGPSSHRYCHLVTVFDYIVLIILITSIIISTVRGLVKEVLSLLAWVAAFIVANTYAPQMAAMLPEGLAGLLPGAITKLIAGFAILFLGTLFIGALINVAIGHLIRVAGLTFADRGLGGLFGLARGLVLVLTGVILAGLTTFPKQPFWREALFSPLAETAVRTLKPMLPPDWARHVHF